MHIPDGFLDAKTWITTTSLSTGAMSYCVSKTRKELSDRQVPRLGVLAAFIFAAQMFNFPIAGGTSGHLLGAALATVLLGPWSAGIVLATVLIIQCFVFQDGGITALGANIFNMSVIGVLVSVVVYSLLGKIIKGKNGMIIASFVAAWLSVIAASFMVTVELALSGTVPFMLALPAMLGVHALIGLGEGVITAAVVLAVVNLGYISEWFNKRGECIE